MSYLDGLKEKVAGVLYKNLSQWKQKITNSPAPELKSFVVQELARMETELVEYNQLMFQHVVKKQSQASPSVDASEKDKQIKLLFQNSVRLLALVHFLLDSTPNEEMTPESPSIMDSVEKVEISEKEMTN